MSNSETQYLNLLSHVMENGNDRSDRTGTGTRSVFGAQMRFDLNEGFPLLTTKRVHFRSIAVELLWFLRGETNVKYLHDHGVAIWDEWADENGDLGPVYGAQWRAFGDATLSGRFDPVDQIANVIEQIKTNPDSRRLIVSAWNPAEVDYMALPPCHTMFQFYVHDGRLSCHLYQRSGDLFLGVPFNIASYALLTHIVARLTGLGVGEFVHSLGDAHIYHNHFDQVRTQLGRRPRDLPTIRITDRGQTAPEDFEFLDLGVMNYDPAPSIPAPVAV